MNNPPKKRHTQWQVCAKLNLEEYLPPKTPVYDIEQAVNKCAMHKLDAEIAASRKTMEKLCA